MGSKQKLNKNLIRNPCITDSLGILAIVISGKNINFAFLYTQQKQYTQKIQNSSEKWAIFFQNQNVSF